MTDIQETENGEANPPPPHALGDQEAELRELLRVMLAVRNGDFSVGLAAH